VFKNTRENFIGSSERTEINDENCTEVIGMKIISLFIKE
jgi:hypothetical protein